jgi:hypothetical protein
VRALSWTALWDRHRPTSWRGEAPDLLEGTSRGTLVRESTSVDHDTRVLD